MSVFTFKGHGSEFKVSSSPWMTMLIEHAPDVLGCANINGIDEDLEAWPTVHFDLVKIHEGMGSSKVNNYEIILEYKITGNDFSKSHIIQLIMGWDSRKQAFVSQHFAMQGYLQPKGWCHTDFPEESSDIYSFDPDNNDWDGPELLIGPQYVKPRIFIEFPLEIFKKLRLVRGQVDLGPETDDVETADMRILMDLQLRMADEENHVRQASIAPATLQEDGLPY